MLLAFLHVLSQGERSLQIPLSLNDRMILRLPPIAFESPLGIASNQIEPEETAINCDDDEIDFGEDDLDGFDDSRPNDGLTKIVDEDVGGIK